MVTLASEDRPRPAVERLEASLWVTQAHALIAKAMFLAHADHVGADRTLLLVLRRRWEATEAQVQWLQAELTGKFQSGNRQTMET